MLRQGPIPRFVHGVIEYLAGAFLIIAPFLLSYDDGSAVGVSIVAGVIVLLIASATEGPTSLIDSIALPVHVVFDYGLAAVLVAAPFLFGFSGEGAPTAAFIALGVAHLLVTVGTRFRSH
ncbi:MAG TPA: hypothetical protein VGW11_11455 [Solirubrobacteraceae bacterium]|nr:hypothetical protein [Solirubrobacteraceae bacterium]